MDFRLLGPVGVWDADRPVRVGGPRPRTVLAALLLRPGHVVSDDTLIEFLWDDQPPQSAVGRLQQCVWSLRGALGKELIERQAPGYVIRTGLHWVDHAAFVNAADRGRAALAAGDAATASAELHTALDLWRGTALGGVTEALARSEGPTLEEDRLAVLEERIEADLALDRHAELIGELQGHVGTAPYRERLRHQLMVALWRAGRRAEALNAYQDCRRLFVTELGVEPGSDLQELQHAILADDQPPSGGRATTTLIAPPEPSAAAPPCLLPPDIADFTGRADQIAWLSGTLTAPQTTAVAVSAVAGKAGVGKTALTVRVAHRLREEYPDGQLYVNLHGAEARPADPAQVLARFLRALGVDSASIPDGVEQRAEQYRGHLGGRRTLVLLDDAADEAQVEPLLPGSASCAVVVTSRSRLTGLAGSRQIELDVLDDEQAIHLLERIIGADRVAAESEAAHELVRLCGGLPLAVRIAAARIAARPMWGVHELVARLADEHRRLDELAHAHLEVRASLSLSYDGLDDAARALFRRLGLLDAPDFAAWIAAQLLDAPGPEAEDALAALVSAQLLDVAGRDRTGQVRYRFHDLIRVFARERARAEEPPEEIRVAPARALAAWLTLCEHAYARLRGGGDECVIYGGAPRRPLDPALVDRLTADPIAWYESERTSIVAGIQQAAQAGWDGLAWHLAVTAAIFFGTRSHYDEWRDTHEHALAVTRAERNARGEAAVLTSFGELLVAKRSFEAATDALTTALHQFERIDDRYGEGLTLYQLAETDRLQTRYDTALSRYRRAVDLLRDNGDHGMESAALRGIGRIHLEQGRLDQAEEALREALETAERSGERQIYAQILHQLGQLYLEQARYDQAERGFVRALGIVKELEDRRGEAFILGGLAYVRMYGGRYQEADTLLTRALTTAHELDDRLLIARLLTTLGELQFIQEDYDRAAANLTRSADLAGQLHLPYWEERARRLLGELEAD